MCLREERIVPLGWEVARGRKTHGLQYGFRIRLPLRREFIVRPLLRVVPAIRRERCFLFHRIKPFRAAPQPRENLLMKKEVLTMSLQIEALSPIMWTIIIAVALVLIAAVVFTWKSSAMSTRKMVTIAMLTAVYVVLNFAGTVRLGWINISVASLPVIVGAMLYGPVGGLLVGLLGAFMGQLLTYGVTATTILWILPQAARGLLVGVYAKHCGYKFTSGQLTLALIGTALVVTALNTGAMYIDSVIYNYYSYAYVFGGLVVRIISGAATAVLMVFVAPPVVNLLNRSLDTVRTAQ